MSDQSSARSSQIEQLRQFVTFALVGVVNVAVDWLIYFALEHTTPFAKPVAKLISFVAAACNSYYLNRRWTFRSTNAAIHREFLKFFAVSVIGALCNTGIFTLMITRFHMADVVGLLTATVVVMLWNFFANKYWTFR